MAQQKRSSNTKAKTDAKKRTNASSRAGAASRSSSTSTTAGKRTAASAKSGSRTSARPEAVAAADAARRSAGLVDRDSRREIAGVVIAVLGIAALIAVLTPSTGVVSQMVSDALHAMFGIGAFILPVVAIVWSVTFFIADRRIMPGRVAAGLAIIAVAVMGLVGITTPNVETSSSILFNQYVLHDRGGFVGNGMAWALTTLFGKTIGIIVLVGLIVCGLVVIGLNFKDAFLEARAHSAARADLRRAQDAQRSRRQQGAYDRAAAYSQDLPRDYAPTALFDPQRPLSGYMPSDNPQASMRPVTGNLYPDGSFVPLDSGVATTLLSMQSIPTTLLPDRGPSGEPPSFGCGNTPRASSVAFEPKPVREPEPESADRRYDVSDGFDGYEGFEGFDDEFSLLDERPAPARQQSALMSGAASLAAKRAARKAESASRWWDPADEVRREEFDPDALKLYPDRTLPGVLPGAPTSFEDLEDGFERIVEENLEVDEVEVHAPVSTPRPSPRHVGTPDPEPARPQAIRHDADHAIEYSEVDVHPKTEQPAAKASKSPQPELPWEAPRSGHSAESATGERPPFKLPDPSVLQRGKRGLKKSPEQERETEEMAVLLQNTLQEFGVKAEVVDWVDGPTFTTYEVNPGEGVRVNKFTSLEDDIARALAQQSVRIYAPVPGTRYVGIEVPNKSKQTVFFGDVLPAVTGGPLDFAIGLDANGKPVHADLAKLPHILIAGTTGSGKSVTVNTIVVSMLMRDTPDDVRLIMIDPKQVEFAGYNGIPHLIMPVVTDMKQAAAALQWGVTEMDRRYRLFSNVGVRELKSYNAQVDSGAFADSEFPLQHLPSIVIVIDELADLMMVAKKDVEASIVRIAQLGRACGIHLVMATQRPSADVVTGLIRANVANRIGLKVAKGTDSKVVIDQTGAEKLLGNGDMLFLQTSFGDKPRRIQGCWLSDDEIASVVEQLKAQQCDDYNYQMAPLPGAGHAAADPLSDQGVSGVPQSAGNEDEPLAWQAAQLVVENQLGSTSMVQRRLKLGYARAGRIMDMLEEMGVVGPARGSKPRDVLIRDLDELETLRGGFDNDAEDF